MAFTLRDMESRQFLDFLGNECFKEVPSSHLFSIYDVVINIFWKTWVALSQRMTASPGNLILHLQLCLCPWLDAGKLLAVLTLNICHYPRALHRLSSKLSLDSLLLQCPKVPTQHVHGDVLSSPCPPYCPCCCLHSPSTFNALTKCWYSQGIPLFACSIHCVWLGPPAQPRHWWSAALYYCLVWLTWAVVSQEQLSQFRCFAAGNKVMPASSWVFMDLPIKESNHIQGTTRHSFGALGVQRGWEGTYEKFIFSWGKSIRFYVHGLRSGLKLPFQKVWITFTCQRDSTLCRCFVLCGQNYCKIWD